MVAFNPRQYLADFFERESLLPDLNRAVRATIGFMVPLLATSYGWIHIDPIHACIVAQTISMVDVRGAYSLRLGLLLAMAAILSATVFLGTLGSGSLIVALLGTVIVISAGGLWRHLSADYGPGLAVSTGLLFFISLADPSKSPAADLHPVIATVVGGLFGVLLQISLWPLHPQHPLRRTVAESWVALANLLSAMAKDFSDNNADITNREVDLRATLNTSQATLHATKRRKDELLRQLELLNIAAARLALRIIGFRTALAALSHKQDSKQITPIFLPALTSLNNLARSIALTVVSRQPSHLAAFEVRMKRLENLLAVARSQVGAQLDDPVASAQLTNILRQIEDQLPIVRQALLATMERANERAAFSLELLDLDTLTLRPLAATLNLTTRVDPTLLRHTFRAIVLSLIGVLFFKLSGFPHGYWLPFTILVVLQPDFGSTRQKAAQRVLGTIAGGFIASSLLWLHPPHAVVISAIGVTIALFAYFQKRNYGVAVVFITLMVVLLTEWHHPVTWEFTAERMGSTIGGGLLALGAAWIFWPAWENRRFPAIMAKALFSNSNYLQLVIHRLIRGEAYDDELIQAGQVAESANSEAFSSLRRMIADPKNKQDGLQQAAALANGNQRVTQALSVIALHLNDQKTRHPGTLEDFSRLGNAAFELLEELERTGGVPATAANTLADLQAFRIPEIAPDHLDPSRFREPWTFPQLNRILTELSAMILITAPSLKS